MGTIRLRVFIASVCLALSATALAQQNSVEPPPNMLQIIREDIKPGKGAAHLAAENARLNALKQADPDAAILGMTSITGSPETWFLEGFPSFAAFEKARSTPAVARINEIYAAKEAAFVSATNTLTGRYHAGYSYKPDFNLGAYKYFAVGILRFPPGTDIAGYFKTLNAAREKAGLDTHYVVYEINSGTVGGTYIWFTPMPTLARWDNRQDPNFLAALRAAGWRDIVGKDRARSEFRLFAFAPRISLPTKEMVEADPAFWNAGAHATPARPKAAKKPAKK